MPVFKFCLGPFFLYPQAHSLLYSSHLHDANSGLQVAPGGSKVGKAGSLSRIFPQVSQAGYHKMYAPNTATYKQIISKRYLERKVKEHHPLRLLRADKGRLGGSVG